MKFDDLLQRFHNEPWFDLMMVKTLFPEESGASIRTAVYRFIREGKLLPLRRGMYCFNTPYAKQPPHGPQLANILYQPSYLSEHWALSWYGIIPEKVGLYTSITPRYTSTFSNSIGAFRYRSVRQPLFTGYEQMELAGSTVLMAKPEKALLDLWYLESGPWSVERMESWRFDPALIQCDRLEEICGLFASARMRQTVEIWKKYAAEYDTGKEIIPDILRSVGKFRL